MTLRLILIRHAKSSWDDPAMDDHDRPLNDRGRRAAPMIGRWLAARGDVPGEAQVSTARRTGQTWELIATELPHGCTVHHRPGLYHASPDRMLEVLRGAHAPVVAMVGHNPGIGAFARWMAAAAPDHPRFADYPTAATTILDFPVTTWTEVRRGSGEVIAFVTPHDLT